METVVLGLVLSGLHLDLYVMHLAYSLVFPPPCVSLTALFQWFSTQLVFCQVKREDSPKLGSCCLCEADFESSQCCQLVLILFHTFQQDPSFGVVEEHDSGCL